MQNFKRTKLACYSSYIGMAAIFTLPPLLFVTFHEMYKVSYTLLGTLVLINFFTQLIIDLIFTFFTKYFNIAKTVRAMPVITSLGLMIYAIVPNLFPQYAYLGLVVGTIIFSVSAGLSEVLLSPLVAAIPSENPDREMSFLHSLYAYGVVAEVVISTVILRIIGTENWMYLVLFWAVMPLITFVLFCTSPIPVVNVSHHSGEGGRSDKKIILFMCVVCIFLGGATENTMTNWVSGYMEKALHVSKLFGDILGMGLFALALGMGRTLYAKYGKNIVNVLFYSMIGSVICYVVAGTCTNVIISMIACVLTGLCTSLLWPGTLIMMEEKLPNVGVMGYALMAAGGDFGGSVAPQLMGYVVDSVSSSKWAESMVSATVTTEQIGMKVGMLTSAVFPILGVILLIFIKRYFKARDGKVKVVEE